MKKKQNTGNEIVDFYYGIFKRNLTLVFITLCMVSVLSLAFFTVATKAEEKGQPIRYKYFTQIEVSYGETLSDIAKQFYSIEYKDHNSYIQEVRNINSLYSQEISPGSFLIVPYYDDIIK